MRIRLIAVALLVAASAAAQTIHPELWPKMTSPVPRDAAMEKKIDAFLRDMTPEEKVGQVIQAGIQHVTPEEVRQYHLGSVLNGGGGWPGDVRKATPNQWLALADSLYTASMDTTGGRRAIPVIWGADAVHGHNNIVGATLFPHNVGLGATHDPELLRRIGEVTAAEMRATGLDWNFSPTVAVSRDRRWGRAYESYSEDPALVRTLAAKMVEGLQGAPHSADFLKNGHVIATSKHFLGDGGTEGGRDQGDNLSTESELRDIHLQGYVGALHAGVQAVMASYNSWHGRKMHGFKELLTDVLKGRMGFDGIVVGDWNGHGQVPGCTNASCAPSLNAGLDMFMVPEDWKALYNNTLAQVRSGEIPQARLDDAVRRILRVKMRAGLFTAGKPSSRKGGGDLASIGSAAHRGVARQAVRESLVLLKNNGGVLPLKPKQNVLVAGDGADSISKQTGGWTLSWQGTENTNADFPGATSIWQGIRSAVHSAGGTATLSADGTFTQKPDVAIVVYGENPYAEFQGDRDNLIYVSDTDLGLVRRLHDAGVPVVSVFLSGRPLWLNPYINASDAFVAAWLPGTEGGGVADVLFRNADGGVPHDFTGKLAFSWPKLPTQSVLNKGDKSYDPLFAAGYGMTYKTGGTLARLPEPDLSSIPGARPNVYFEGTPVKPWQLYVSDTGAPILVGGAAPVSSTGGAVSIQPVERPGRDAGRQVRFSGRSRGEVFLQAAQPIDLSRQSNGDLALTFDAMVDKAPAAPVMLSVGSGAIDIAPMLGTPGQWQPVTIRLRCFALAGADMTRLDTPFRVASERELTFSFAGVQLVPATGANTCPNASEKQSPASGVLFDDFNYRSLDELAAHEWIVRSAAGWPGIPGATWGGVSVTDGVVRMSAQTDGTHTQQAQLCHQRRYLEGTYAARVRFTDAPVEGPNGDQVVQSFYQISPIKAPMDPDYSELDFEYLPNGGWGHKPPTLFVTTWETFSPEPNWKADNVSNAREGALGGWHTLVLTVGKGVALYSIDGTQLAGHDGKFYPEVLMSLNFNLWFIRDQMIPGAAVRRWVEDIDWAYHNAGVTMTPAQVESEVAALRKQGVAYRSTVPPANPPLPSPCNF